jgi:hypothetical protein
MAYTLFEPRTSPSVQEVATKLVKRARLSDAAVISIIIPLVMLSILSLAVVSYVIRRYLACRREKKQTAHEASLEAPTPPPLAERRQSNWARQNSNVLWSMYINDDDLRRQFAQPSKDSRLYSIGSVSTLGPLDTVSTSVTVEHDEKPEELNKDSAKIAVDRLSTPRRATCANVQGQRSVGFGRRKLSLTTS